MSELCQVVVLATASFTASRYAEARVEPQNVDIVGRPVRKLIINFVVIIHLFAIIDYCETE